LSDSPSSPKPDLSGLRIDRDAPAAETAGRRRLVPIVLGAVILLLVAVLSVIAVNASKPVEVTVAPAVSMGGGPGSGGGSGGGTAPGSWDSGAEVLTANGYVVARQRASVSTEVAGRLEALYVGEGSRVKQGDVLGVLRNRDQRTAVEAARAALASAKASHEEAMATRDQEDLDLKRTAELLQRGLVSQAEFDAAEARAKVARARVDRTKADIESAEAGLKVAEVELDKTFIRAPFAGAILRKEAEVGEIVSPIPSSGGLTRGAIVTMANLATLEVEVDVNEGYVARAREGMRAAITLDAYPGDRYSGRVRQIVPTADRSKATVLVKVAFDSLDSRVLPEMGVRVSFLADPEPAAGGGSADAGDSGAALAAVVLIPKSAVRDVNGRATVFVVENGRAVARSVAPRPAGADRVAISGGLAPDEAVIVEGPPTLKDKTRVRVRGAGGGTE
jgi:RND family efflux transporter MFP subunit